MYLNKSAVLFAIAAIVVVYFLAKVSVPQKYEHFTEPDVFTYKKPTSFYDFGNRSMFP